MTGIFTCILIHGDAEVNGWWSMLLASIPEMVSFHADLPCPPDLCTVYLLYLHIP